MSIQFRKPSSSETSLIFPLANWTPLLVYHTALNCKYTKKTHDLPLKTGLHSCILHSPKDLKHLSSLYFPPSLYLHSQFSHQVLKIFTHKSFWNIFLPLFYFCSFLAQMFIVSNWTVPKRNQPHLSDSGLMAEPEKVQDNLSNQPWSDLSRIQTTPCHSLE